MLDFSARLNYNSVKQKNKLATQKGDGGTMRREQLFDTAHEAFTFLRNYTKHGWLGYVEQVGDKFKLVITC